MRSAHAAFIVGTAMVAYLGPLPAHAQSDTQKPPSATKAAPIDKEAWGRRLAGLEDLGPSEVAKTVQELVSLPPDEGFSILKANWDKIEPAVSRSTPPVSNRCRFRSSRTR